MKAPSIEKGLTELMGMLYQVTGPAKRHFMCEENGEYRKMRKQIELTS